MDNFKEQLVCRASDARVWLLRGMIIAAELCLIALLVLITMVYTQLFSIVLLLMFGSFILLRYLLTNTVVEYEYIVTNNDFDVDKIIGRRKRKRMISIRLSDVREIGEYSSERGGDAEATVLASDGTGCDMWYILSGHAEYKTVLIIFTPNDEVLDTINPSLPYAVRMKREPRAAEDNDSQE